MYVYILKCNDNSYYTGVTNNIERRLAEHQSGINETCYTYKRRPVILMFFEKFPTPMAAICFEKQVKGWTRSKKEALIANNWDKLHKLAKCENSTSHKNHNPPFDSAQGDKNDSAQGGINDSAQGGINESAQGNNNNNNNNNKSKSKSNNSP